MKLRALIVGLAISAAGVAVANCGSEEGSQFSSSGGTEDSGASSSSGSGFGPQEEGGASSGNNGCKPLTCADLKINCGPAGDGCGGVIKDCGTCQSPQTCGGGGAPSVCGGTAGCVGKTCQDLGIGCGPAGDGCGAQIDCKACAAPQICGGGGPSKCGGGQATADGGVLLPDGGACVARTVCNAGECGPVADGCGGLLTCGGCAVGESCGGGGVASQCGAPVCTKLTCTSQGANCGYVADGCGGIVNCGGAAACTVPGEVCGGGGPNKCGVGTDGGNASCINFCPAQVANDTCAVGNKTKLTGTVFAPNGTLPIPDAVVYIPNGSTTFPYGTTAFVDGVSGGVCDQCNVQVSGPPLGGVTVKSAFDGTFTLDNVPVGVSFPIVIQLGRWRRLVTITPRTACTTTALTAAQTRLPTRQDEGNARDNIPLVAISTGYVDGLECVFKKLGIETSQFGNPAGYTGAGGRIRLYRDNDADTNGDGDISPNEDALGGARINSSTPRTDTALTDTQAHLDQYDAVIMGCAGAPNPRSSARLDRVRAYADKGGRLFATHFEYVYLNTNNVWASTVAWDPSGRNPQNVTWEGDVDTTPGKRELFSKWIAVPAVNAAILPLTNPPRIGIYQPRNDADRPVTVPGAEEWITYHNDPNPPTAVLHYTFNTPWGSPSANQCGRVLFSDFHVSIGSTYDTVFPNECNNNALTAQEKVLAFFLFDLTACIQPTTPPPPPTCQPLTCAAQGIACGQAGDGCGGFQTCPACPPGQLCQGNPPVCITPSCTPKDCAAQGANCGTVPNGCGGTVSCGPCTVPGQVCGGGGPNQCGANTCTPIDCNAQNIHCGPAGNGCGGLLDCGPCPTGQTCGGGGTAGVCGAPACTARTCAQANANCGFIADGCGGLVDCGPCPNGQSCGGGGTPNQCGGTSVPK